MGMLTALAMVLIVSNVAGRETAPAARGSAAFQQLKGLVGHWRGKRPDGREVGVTYRLSADGTVLVETWDLGPQRESLTIYHMDGRELLATHFCPQGNQPRLRLTHTDANRLDFTLQEATGMEPGQAVQHDFWIKFGEDGTITRSETYIKDDQAESETITYKRAHK